MWLALLLPVVTACVRGDAPAAGAGHELSLVAADDGAAEGPRLTFLVPAAWDAREVGPDETFRVAAYGLPRVPGDPEDAELVITRFPGGVGPREANLSRWRSQFEGENEGGSRDASRGGLQVTVLDLRGTYRAAASMQSPGTPRVLEEARGVFLLLEASGVAWAAKFLGTARTLSAQEAGITAFIGSLALAEGSGRS